MVQESSSWLLWASLAAMSLLYYLLVIRPGTTSRRLPPGPRPLPLIGNLLDLRGNLHHALARLAQAHGPVMCLRMGLTTTVVVSSRDALREAFTKHDRRLAARNVPDATRVLGLHSASMLYQPSSHPQWKTMRGIMASHVVSPRSLAATRGAREGKVRDLVRYFRERAADGRAEAVDVSHAVFGGVLNLISSTFFSVDAVRIGEASVHGLHEQMEVLLDTITKPNVSDLFPFLRRLDLQGRRREVTGYMKSVFRILDGIVERRLASKDKHDNDFLDTLLDLLSTGKIDRNTVRAFMLELFVAGSDTTASTVSWTMAELLHNPSVMAKAREEIKATFGSNKEAIEEPEAARLPYLQAVVKEAMRLHPVAPLLLPHKAVEDGVEIGGYVVPKGSTVLFNSWAIMRDETLWERPEEFVPERFVDAAAREQVDFRGSKEFDFLPFGTGRRQCPGLPLAERVVPHVVASLLHAFEWRLPDGVSADQLDLSERFTTVNYLAVPLKAVPVVI